MTTSHNPLELPPDLPVPTDDGACLHLRGCAMPSISVSSTGGARIDLSRLTSPAVVFLYPRTGVPGQPPSLGFSGETWESIAGARGCTPQSCGFRDLYAEFASLGTVVYGLATNTTEHQLEFKGRNHVPFDFLSDSDLRLTRTLRLPTFEFPVESGGPTTLLRRAAWFIEPDSAGTPRIRRVFYPVFPPDRNAEVVLAWLRARRSIAVVPAAAEHREFLVAELHRHWFSTTISSRGKAFSAHRLPALVAIEGGRPVGHATLVFDDRTRECEVITLSSSLEDRGIGSLLLDHAEDAARARRCTRLFLTTTNDNLRALRFYQRRGMRIAAVYPGMIDRYRAAGSATPVIGASGIPCRDEIELTLQL